MTKRITPLLGTTLAAGLFALAAPAAAQMSPAYVPDMAPPVSNPGECYARVKIPAQYETRTETVMTQAPFATSRVTQPRFETRQEQVMVREPSVRFEVTQPRFESVAETIVTRPAYDKLSVTAPRFTTETQTLTMSEPQLVWKKGNPGELQRQGYIIHSTADAGRGGRGYSSTTQYGQQNGTTAGGTNCGPTCEIWCLVEEPGTQETFSRRVMSHPGGVQRTRVPARTQTVNVQVVADPGGVREVPVPGQFRSVTVEDLVDAGGEFSENTPPTYGQVQGRVMVAPERYEWRRVVCQPGTQTGGRAPVSGGMTHGSASGGSMSYGTMTHGTMSGGSYSQGGAYGSQSGGSISGGSISGGMTSGGVSGTTGYIDAYPFGSQTGSSPAYGSGSMSGAGSINEQLDRATERGRGGRSVSGYGSDVMAGGYNR